MKRKVVLALGSGASRGWSHIGVIDALEESGVEITAISGTSIGAFIAAVYAGGGLASLKDFVLEMEGKRVFAYSDIMLSTRGFIKGSKKLDELFSMHTEVKDFSDLSIPVKMVATDLFSGKKIVIDKGDLFTGMRASMSLPGIFEPIKYKNRWLIDGGVVDPIPIAVARTMGDYPVVAVDLNAHLVSHRMEKIQNKHLTSEKSNRGKEKFLNLGFTFAQKFPNELTHIGSAFMEKMTSVFKNQEQPPHMGDVMSSYVDIVQDRITRVNLAVDPPDILIQPRLGNYNMLDFGRVSYAIEEGYRRMLDQIEELDKMPGVTEE
jgi:NTE family protein